MPIVITGTPVNPAEPTEVMSPDGILHVWASPAHGGFRLYANFSVVSITPDKVSFVREDGTSVRGGDHVPAVGAEALGFDHEPPLGATTGFRAIAYNSAGAVIYTSQIAAVFLPEPEGLLDLWVKSLADHRLSMLVSARIPAPEIVTAGRLNFVTAQGATYPAGTFDRRTRSSVEIVVRLPTVADRKRWDNLLDSGHLLLQWRSSYGEEDFYAVADESRRSILITMTDQRRDVRTAFVPIKRPTTTGTVAQIPGRTIGEAMILAPTVLDSLNLWPTVLDAAGFSDA